MAQETLALSQRLILAPKQGNIQLTLIIQNKESFLNSLYGTRNPRAFQRLILAPKQGFDHINISTLCYMAQEGNALFLRLILAPKRGQHLLLHYHNLLHHHRLLHP